MKKRALVITGNPGTGKHTSANLIAAKLRGSTSIIDINKVAIDNDAFIRDRSSVLEVDSKKLNRLLSGRLQRIKEDQNVLVVGHLAPYVLNPSDVDLVAILRRSPYELLDTFFARGYTAEKSKNNAASEILGVVSFDALETFGKYKAAEFDTSRKPPEKTADEIVLTLQGRLARRIGFVDWLALVEERNDLHKFFDLK